MGEIIFILGLSQCNLDCKGFNILYFSPSQLCTRKPLPETILPSRHTHGYVRSSCVFGRIFSFLSSRFFFIVIEFHPESLSGLKESMLYSYTCVSDGEEHYLFFVCYSRFLGEMILLQLLSTLLFVERKYHRGGGY